MHYRHLFGPVPSRRFGRSLGIDLVPFKTCSFDCLFCEVGATTCLTLKRDLYVPVKEVTAELADWLNTGAPADFITLAGSGEPTLHAAFGEVLRLLKSMTSIRTALLTNGSLLGDPAVRADAAEADVVKVSLSAWDQESLARINRPVGAIGFERLFEGMREFRRAYAGHLWMEVFVVPGINDSVDAIRRIAGRVNVLKPARIHLNSLARPPADASVHPVEATRLKEFAVLFEPVAEVIGGSAIEPSPCQTPSRERLLAVLRRRPCTVEDIAVVLGCPEAWAASELASLVLDGLAEVHEVSGRQYYRGRSGSADA